ncbi:hypothetical protein PV721_22760 [Streptomyces sp. MB09-01]|uniref:hypothetical protein n=1 Tax=Streptomyces sp. MB09-01 TaxID=3028666 RepID=UPI0029BC16BF|nr:hypothetical protein [Streptomyces sp. MB09-01]MDX3537143.1 hypothetical protein [Streptomyces sp. MB09-01]
MTPRLRIGDDEVRVALTGPGEPSDGDRTNHLDMETGPVPLDGLRAELEQFRRDLA